MIPGLDVYSGYGRINWKLVASAGYRFVWAQCARGNDAHADDAMYRRNVDEARANGMAAGAYFFAYPLPPVDKKTGLIVEGRSPIEQAGRFFEVSGGLGSRPGELAPMVDLEWPPPEKWDEWGCSAEQISEWGREFCEAVTLLWGRLPVIYTYPWFESRLGVTDDHWAGRYPLAMAAYTHQGEGMPEEGKSPPVPPPWLDWAVWQHSADGSKVHVPGISVSPVDRDVIKDEETFRQLTNERVWDPDAETQPSVRPPVAPPEWATVTRLPFSEDSDPDPEAA